jgi:hypothetical protein
MRKINIVWAEGLSSENLIHLRDQVSLAIADPSFTIIANYEIHWTQIELKDNEVPRIVWADSLSPVEVDFLREQVDMALADPDFAIVTNYEVHVEGIDTVKKIEREVKPYILLTRFEILKRGK